MLVSFMLLTFLPSPQTMEFELRKFEAQQAAEEIKLLKSFLPNSFLAIGGVCAVASTVSY